MRIRIINKANPFIKHEKLLQQHECRSIIKSPRYEKIEMQLRGGGCGNTKSNFQQGNYLKAINLPPNFLEKLEHHSNVLIENSKKILDELSRNEIMLSLQWFHYNNEFLNKICQSNTMVGQVIDIIQKKFEYLLQVLPMYVRSSGFLCYKVLQILNELLRIIYSFQSKNKQRFIEIAQQQLFLQYIDKFYIQLGIESAYIWRTGIEYEMTLIKIMLMNCRTNSKEGQQLLTSFAFNLVSSAIAMAPSEELTASMVKGAQYLLKAGYEKVQYPIEVYETYYFFQTLKWQIIGAIKSNFSVISQLNQLQEGYQQYIQVSNNWIIHYSWIQMICDLFSYRPVINKPTIFQGQEYVIQQQNWNSLQQTNIIRPLPYDQNEGVLQLFKENQVIKRDIQKSLSKLGIKQFQVLSNYLMKEKLSGEETFWDFYSKFRFEKKSSNTSTDSQIVYSQIGMNQLTHLRMLFIYCGDQIYNLFVELFDSLSKQSKTISKTQEDLYKDEIQKCVDQIWNKLFEFLLIVIQIMNIIRLEIAQFNLLYSSIQLDSCSKNKLADTIKEQFNKLSTTHNQFSEHVLLIKQQIINLQDNCIKFKVVLESMKLQEQKEFFEQQSLNKVEWLPTGQKLETLLLNFIEQNQKLRENLILFINQRKIDLTNLLYITEYQFLEILVAEDLEKSIIQYFGKIKECISAEELQSTQVTDQIIYTQNLQNNLIKVKMLQKFFKILKGLQQIHILKLQQLQSSLQQRITAKNDQKEELRENEKSNLKSIIDDLLQSIIALSKQQILNSDNLSIKQLKQTAIDMISSLQFDLMTISNGQLKLEDFIKKIQSLQNNNQQVVQFQTTFSSAQTKNFRSTLKISLKVQENSHQLVNRINEQYKQTISQLKQFYSFLLINKRIFNINNQELNQLTDEQNKKWKDYSSNVLGKCEQLFKTYEDLNNENRFQNISFPEGCTQISQECFLYIFYGQENNLQNPEIQLSSLIESILQSFDIHKFTQKSFFQFETDYKVRECLIYNLMKIQGVVSEDVILKFVQQQLKQIWVVENDECVRALLKKKELLDMQKKLFSSDIKTLSTQIKLDMKERLLKMESLEQEIRLEGNEQLRQNLQNQLNLTYEEMDQYLDNISDMSAAMDISLVFLKEISKDLKNMKQKINAIQDTVNSIGDDIRKLRGKRYDEILRIRKQKVLMNNNYQELDSVYIPLQTIEYDPISGEVVKTQQQNETSQLLVENIKDICSEESFEGEVNEFLWYQENTKDVLLIKGKAGSGKSCAARKIEIFLWKSYGDQSKWIPIYVSLPSLKDPKYSLLDQALESEAYNFDQTQIKEFKEVIQNHQQKIVFILDSYDEMKQECIQSNLIITNKLSSDLNISEPGKYIKFIITTRREILNTLGYQTWFYGSSLATLKEVELINFTTDQVDEYLRQFVFLSAKRKVRNLYEFVKQLQGSSFNLEEFLEIWLLISDVIINCCSNQQKDQLVLFLNKEEEIIIQRIKQHSCFKFLKDEQITSLRKDLQDLWSHQKFKKSIKNINIEDLLTTPFMLEIVVQVLPSMTKKYSGSVQFKDQFIQNYAKLLQQSKQSELLIKRYQNMKNESDELNQPIYCDDFQIKNSDNEYQMAQKILDLLESKKFFQFYSLTDRLQLEGDTMKFSSKVFKIGNEAELIVKALQMKKFTIYEFYQGFINYYHEQQVKKLGEFGKVYNIEGFLIDVFQFSQSLAIDMTINQQTQVLYKQKGHLRFNDNQFDFQQKQNWEEKYFQDNPEDQEYKKMIRSCALLTSKGASYSFNHKSIQEFYVAKYVCDLLMNIKLDQNEIIIPESCNIIKKSLFNNNKFNLANDTNEGILKLLNQQLEILESLHKKLKEIVRLSRQTDFIRASSNSVCLLGYMGIYLGMENLNSIKLQDADLSTLTFFGSDLSNSTFQNVEIDQCNFNFANLQNIQWNDIVLQEKPILRGHTNSVLIVTFSSNGKYLASSGRDTKILIRDLENYTEINRFIAHEDYIFCLLFSSDDSKLISASQNGQIKIWNTKNIEKCALLKSLDGHQQPIIKVTLSQDEKLMYSCDAKGNVIIWDFENLLESQDMFIGGEDCDLCSLTFTSDGLYLYTINLLENEIRLYELKSQKCVIKFSYQDIQIFELHLSADDKYLVARGRNASLIIWNVQNKLNPFRIFIEQWSQKILGFNFSSEKHWLALISEQVILIRKIQNIIKQEDGIIFKNSYCIEFSPNDEIQTLQAENSFYIVDGISHQLINSYPTENFQVNYFQFQSAGSLLATKNSDNTIFIFDLESLLTPMKIIGNNNQIKQLNSNTFSFSSDGSIFFLQNSDCFNYQKQLSNKINFVCFDENNTQNLITHPKYYIFLNNLSLLLSANEEKIIYYEIGDNKINKIAGIDKINGIIKDLKYSPSKNLVGLNFNKCIQLLNFQKRDKLYNLEGGKDDCYSMTVCLDKFLLIGSANLFILWNLQLMRKQLIVIDQDIFGQCLLKNLITLNQNEVILSRNKIISTVKIDELQSQSPKFYDIGTSTTKILILAYSPLQKLTATADDDQKIYLWDTEAKKKIAAYQGHGEEIATLNFSPDGKTIASGGYDCKAKLWNVKANQKITIQDGHNNIVTFLTYSKDGLLLASGSADFSIRLWDVVEKKCINKLLGHTQSIQFIMFSDQQKHLISFGQDGQIILWELSNLNDLKPSLAINQINVVIQKVDFLDNFSLLSLQKAVFNKQNKERKTFIVQWSIKNLIYSHRDVIFKTNKNNSNFFFLETQNKKVQLLYLDQAQHLCAVDLQENEASPILLENHPINYFFVFNNNQQFATIDNKEQFNLWMLKESEWKQQFSINIQQFLNYDVQQIYLIDNGNQIAFLNSENQMQILNIKNSHLYTQDKDINLEEIIVSLSVINLIDNSIAISFQGRENDEEIYDILWFQLDNFNSNKLFKGHKGLINSICFSFDGQYIAAAGEDKIIFIWNLETRESVGVSEIDEQIIDQLSFLKDDNQVVIYISYNPQGSITIWNFKNNVRTTVLTLNNSIYLSCISSFGRRIVLKQNKLQQNEEDLNRSLQVLDIKHPENIFELEQTNQAEFVQFYKNENKLILGFNDGIIQIWDVQAKIQISTHKFSQVKQLQSIALSENDAQLYLCEKETIWLIETNDTGTLSIVNYYRTKKEIKKLQFFKDNQQILVQSQSGALYIIQNDNFYHRNFFQFEINQKQLTIQQSESNDRLFYIKQKDSLNLYNFTEKNTFELKQTMKCNADQFLLAFNSAFIALSFQGGSLKLMTLDQLSNSENIEAIQAHDAEIISMSVSQNSKYLATQCEEHFIKLWVISDKKIAYLKALFRSSYETQTNQLLFSNSSKYLGYCSENNVHLINIQNCAQEEVIEELELNSFDIVTTPQNIKLIAKASEAGLTIQQFNLKNKNVKSLFDGKNITLIKFSPSGSFLVSNHEDDIYSNRLWSGFSQENGVIESAILTGTTSYIVCFCFSPDSQLVLGGCRDGWIYLWSVQTKENVVYAGLNDFGTSVIFSPDGFHFAVGIHDGSIYLFISNLQKEKFAKQYQKYLEKMGNEPVAVSVKIFAQQSLIQAIGGNIENAQINHQLKTLFKQKGAVPE